MFFATIKLKVSGEDGGGQGNFPQPTVRNVVFTANTARFGGGMGRKVDELTRAENSYHVVRSGTDIDSTAVLDGFTITAGNANTLPPQIDDKGGGLYILGGGQGNFPQPTVRNVVFTANTARFGGGMGNTFASPTVTNAVFIDNVAAVDGGGIHNFLSAAIFRDLVFRNNKAEGLGGGWWRAR